MSGTLYVCPVMNTYGPATDPKHADLLNNWEIVHKALEKLFDSKFRNSLVDDNNQSVQVSWFINSWSGFESNPVNRDFGWFNVHDAIINTWKDELKKWDDGIFWIYNHPDESRVGNKWGLDWNHNTHYFKILSRMILDKGYFPKFLQIPTADTLSTNFVENYFPFELSNRHSKLLNWENIEADGRKTKDILKWDKAPDSWIPYHPEFQDHQVPGSMKHKMFRLLDIKTRIITFPESEIEKAFVEASEGHNCMIAGYEHDFRDRADATRELFLEPINKFRAKYPKVKVINANAYQAGMNISKKVINPSELMFHVSSKCDHIEIVSNTDLFNTNPFVCYKTNEKYIHISPTKTASNTWSLDRDSLPSKFQLGIAGFSKNLNISVKNVLISESNVHDFEIKNGYNF